MQTRLLIAAILSGLLAASPAAAGLDTPPVAYTAGAGVTITGQAIASTITQYTDGAAVSAAQAGMTSFANPNLAMPNGANIAHTIYQGRGALTLSGTSEQSCFVGTGDGNQTLQPAAMFLGARFRVTCVGIGQTGALNVATVTAKVKFGSTVISSGVTAALPASLSSIPFRGDVVCVIRSVGSSGTAVCTGGLAYATGLSSSAPLLTDLTATSAVTINTTVTQKLDATITMSSAVGSPSLAVYDAYILQEN